MQLDWADHCVCRARLVTSQARPQCREVPWGKCQSDDRQQGPTADEGRREEAEPVAMSRTAWPCQCTQEGSRKAWWASWLGLVRRTPWLSWEGMSVKQQREEGYGQKSCFGLRRWARRKRCRL